MHILRFKSMEQGRGENLEVHSVVTMGGSKYRFNGGFKQPISYGFGSTNHPSSFYDRQGMHSYPTFNIYGDLRKVNSIFGISLTMTSKLNWAM